MRALDIFKDKHSTPAYGIKITDAGFQALLSADTQTTLSVPVGARIAVFGYENHLWVSDEPITLPTTSTFASSNAMLNPPPLVVSEGDYNIQTLYFRMKIGGEVSVAFYR